MISITVPNEIRKVADRYKDVFFETPSNYNCICVLLCLHLFGMKSLSSAARDLGWSQSVSSIQSNLHKFTANRFMRRLRSGVLNKLKNEINYEDFCYAIDDTSNIKSGKNVFGIGNWGKSNNNVYTGQKIFVLSLVNKRKGYALPLHYFICEKIDSKVVQSGHELTIKLLKDIFDEGYPILPVALDSWFDSISLMQNLDDLKVPFCIHTKDNRKVRHCRSSKVPWKTWKSYFKNKTRYSVKLLKTEHQKRSRKTKYIQESFVYIKGRKSILKTIAVYNKLTDSRHFSIYVTNDLKMSGAFLYELGRKRWLIEELFRNLKQKLSFGKLSCTGKVAADLSICLPFALIISLHLSPNELHQKNVQSNTIGTKIELIKAENFEKSLYIIMHNISHLNANKLKARRRIDRINKKPVDSFAEERIAY
jgi:Transposase DDE domain